MGLLMRSPPVELSSGSIYDLRSRWSRAAVGNAPSTSLVVLGKSASMVPRSEARCPAGALFTRVRGIGLLRSSLAGSCIERPQQTAGMAPGVPRAARGGPHVVVVHKDSGSWISTGLIGCPYFSE